jgi:hypothetical protein
MLGLVEEIANAKQRDRRELSGAFILMGGIFQRKRFGWQKPGLPGRSSHSKRRFCGSAHRRSLRSSLSKLTRSFQFDQVILNKSNIVDSLPVAVTNLHG